MRFYFLTNPKPAIQAVIKHATFPAIIALRTMVAISAFLCGAIAPNPPNIIPIEPRLANPHKAYVEITSDRCYNTEVTITVCMVYVFLQSLLSGSLFGTKGS